MTTARRLADDVSPPRSVRWEPCGKQRIDPAVFLPDLPVVDEVAPPRPPKPATNIGTESLVAKNDSPQPRPQPTSDSVVVQKLRAPPPPRCHIAQHAGKSLRARGTSTRTRTRRFAARLWDRTGRGRRHPPSPGSCNTTTPCRAVLSYPVPSPIQPPSKCEPRG